MDEIAEKLLEIEKTIPNAVRSRFNLGDLVSVNLHMGTMFYKIDSLDLHNAYGAFDSDEEFYLTLPKHMKSRGQHIGYLFPPNQDEPTPLSKAIQSGIGECVEKGVLIQLRHQDDDTVFYVTGLLGHVNLRREIIHAFNIRYIDGKPFLIDAENFIVDTSNEQKEFAYIVPITGFDGTNFELDDKSRFGRIYRLDDTDNCRTTRSILSMFG